jgi:hypothetical protein
MHVQSQALCPLFLSSSPEEGEQEHEYRSINDYMGGWHAGKFDFDTRIGGVTALNYEKSVVFDGDIDKSKPGTQLAALEDDTSIPKWASRPIKYELAPKFLLARQQDDGSLLQQERVCVVNEEVSWEPFYATIETEGGAACDYLTVSPANGTLAPRGGADIYTDTCQFTVDVNGADSACLTSGVHLVVRTELDRWTWQVELD